MEDLTRVLSVLFLGTLVVLAVLLLQPDPDLEKEEREASELNDAIQELKAALIDPLDNVASHIFRPLKKAFSGPIVSGYLHRDPFHGKLKPCPFCGAEIIEAAVTLEGYTNVLLIHCSRCGTDFELHEQDRDTYTTIDGDIYQIVNGSPFDLWNTRASDGKGGK